MLSISFKFLEVPVFSLVFQVMLEHPSVSTNIIWFVDSCLVMRLLFLDYNM